MYTVSMVMQLEYVLTIQGKLELITGATAALMQLQLFDREGKMVCELDDDSASLGSSGVQDGWRVSVVDRDPNKQRGEFEDMSQVKKYEMNNEEYAKRQGDRQNLLQ